MGKAILECGNQRWGEASSCQSSPICARCQRRTGEGGRVTMNELLVLFKDAQVTRELGCTARLFVGHRCARPPPRRAVQPRKVLFCSPRDISFVKASSRMGCPLPNCGWLTWKKTNVNQQKPVNPPAR